MKKLTKIIIAIAVLLTAGMTSMSVFANSDNGTNASNRFEPLDDTTRTTEQERREHLKEQVERGNLSPDEAEEMNEWMDDTNRDCHGRDSFGCCKSCKKLQRNAQLARNTERAADALRR